jgi:hypothetical protein
MSGIKKLKLKDNNPWILSQRLRSERQVISKGIKLWITFQVIVKMIIFAIIFDLYSKIQVESFKKKDFNILLLEWRILNTTKV